MRPNTRLQQLHRDRQVAAYYQVNIQTRQGDMPGLSHLPAHAFDIVWQPYSLNFVPNAQQVFREVARVVRPAGLYRFNCANPFVSGLTERDWTGQGYLLKRPYQQGTEISYSDPDWVYATREPLPRPREYRHTLSTLINGLIAAGFTIQHVSDYTDFYPNSDAEPGTRDHFTAIAPPWLTLWAVYRPHGFE